MGHMISRLLSRITKDPMEQKNIKHLGLNMLIQNADTPLYNGTELQAFQARVGLGTGQMGSMAAAGTISTVITMFLCTSLVDRTRNRVNATAWAVAGMSLFPLSMVVMCLGPASFRTPRVVYALMIAFGVITSVFVSLNSMLWATVFSRSIRFEVRGRFMGLIGVVGGIIGILIGLVSAAALKKWGFPHGFMIAFAIASTLIITSSFVLRGIRELPDLKGTDVASQVPPLENLKKVVKMRQFKLLLPANVLRGLGDGAGVFAMAVGMKRLGLSSEYAGYTTSMVYLAGLIATLLIGFTVDRFGAGKVIPRVNSLLAIGLMGMVLVSNPILYLVSFLLWQTMLTMEGICVPLIHYEIVPVEVIGAFSGIRLLTLTAMIGLSGLVMGYLLESIPALVVFGFCALLKIMAGLLYAYGVKIFNREQQSAAALIEDTTVGV